jgi:hypothetical protein
MLQARQLERSDIDATSVYLATFATSFGGLCASTAQTRQHCFQRQHDAWLANNVFTS